MHRAFRSSFVSSVCVARVIATLSASVVVFATAAPEAAAQAAKKPSAKDRTAARDAYNAGTAAFNAGDYEKALENFEKANNLIPSPQAQFWVAQSLDKLDRKEEAIVAYERLAADPDFEKIGTEKVETTKTRLEALKAPPAEPEPEPAPEPVAEPEPEPAPPEPLPEPTTPPEPEPDDDLTPKANTFEIGLFTGPLFVAGNHNLREGRFPVADYSALSWLLGLRAGYFPLPFLGIEAEYAHGWGSVEAPEMGLAAGGDGAEFNTVRGHVIAQLPSSRFVPFVLAGAGVLQATSDRLGADGDFLLELGLGAKFFATKMIVPRIDVRLDMTQKEGGGFGDGVSLHPEVLLGLSVALGK